MDSTVGKFIFGRPRFPYNPHDHRHPHLPSQHNNPHPTPSTMSAVAGPSSAKKSSSSKKTKAAAAAAPPARSESVVDSSSEDESENESVNSDDLDRVVVPSTPAASASTPRASKSRSGMA